MMKPTNIFVLFAFGVFLAFLFPALFQLKILVILVLGVLQMLLNALVPMIPIAQIFGTVLSLGTLIVIVVTIPVLLFKKLFGRKNDNDFDIFGS